MTSPKFSTWRPNQGTRIMVAFQLFVRLEMTFSHSTLGAAPLNDEEAHECEKLRRSGGLHRAKKSINKVAD